MESEIIQVNEYEGIKVDNNYQGRVEIGRYTFGRDEWWQKWMLPEKYKGKYEDKKRPQKQLLGVTVKEAKETWQKVWLVLGMMDGPSDEEIPF